jgi:hypothetical protein
MTKVSQRGKIGCAETSCGSSSAATRIIMPPSTLGSTAVPMARIVPAVSSSIKRSAPKPPG